MEKKEFHPTPEWLTAEYFQPILRKYTKDASLTIRRLEAKPATAKGENYASIMTRLHVDYTTNESSQPQSGNYIVKTTYENDRVIADIMNQYDVYHTEMAMYESVLPQLSALLREAGDQDKLFANTIHVDYDHSAIIFEDLAVLEYVIADRLVGMDLNMAKLALRKLAKMHATAAVLQQRGSYDLQRFDRGIFNRHTRGFANFFVSMFGVCAKFAADCPELGVYYQDKLLKLQEHVMEYTEQVIDSHEEHFETLNHGDFWINNVMLRYKNGVEGISNGRRAAVKDLLLIDFQFCSWVSPAVDLNYFFQTSLQSDVLRDNEDELVQHYHGVLRETLQQLQFTGKIPSLHAFVRQLEAGRFHAVVSAIANAPMMKNDKTEDADFHALMDNDERARKYRTLTYQNKVVQDDLKRLLPYFDRKGLLDVVH